MFCDSNNFYWIQVVTLFHEIRNAELGIAPKAATNGRRVKKGGNGDAASVLEELQKNSPYLSAIRADTISFGAEIKRLIDDMALISFPDMAHLGRFVQDTDLILEKLSDEPKVLKNFEWPEKYYTFREADSLYNELTKMTASFREWQKKPRKSLVDNLQDMQTFAVSDLSHCFLEYLKL